MQIQISDKVSMDHSTQILNIHKKFLVKQPTYQSIYLAIGTWHIGIPVSLSTTSQSIQNPHPLYIQVSDNWPPLPISLSLHQDGGPILTKFLVESSTNVNISSVDETWGCKCQNGD